MAKTKVLVPTNFNIQSEQALVQSIFFAKKINADIVLLHVIEGSINKEEKIKKSLADIKHCYKDLYNIEIQIRIAIGKVIPSILKVEKELNPEFIFIGKDPLSKPFYSTTINLIDGVRCPVVVITSRYKQRGCKKIVLPLDLTKETRQKVELTIKIAQTYGSEVHVISTTNIKDEIKINKLRKQIQSVKEAFINHSIPVKSEFLIIKGSKEIMANAINDYADDIKADLIVIMTRQEKSIEKLFVGSMATKLIKKTSVPVLCISPKN